jgi:hypothetical protein
VAKKPAAQVAETPTETDAKPFVTIKVQQQADEASRKKMLGVLEKVEGASVRKEKKIMIRVELQQETKVIINSTTTTVYYRKS